VLNVVSVDEGKIEQGASAAITVTSTCRPEFALPDYVGLPTTIGTVDPTDAEIDSVIQACGPSAPTLRPAERAAAKGDYVKLSYEGSIDGKKISEIAGDKQLYAKVPQTWEEVEGANEGIIPGLGKQLAGVSKGDKKTVTITFPGGFPAGAGPRGQDRRVRDRDPGGSRADPSRARRRVLQGPPRRRPRGPEEPGPHEPEDAEGAEEPGSTQRARSRRRWPRR
jgi:hypothetical protein